MESMPIASQLALVAEARGLAGIHGAGMAWVAMLHFPRSPPPFVTAPPPPPAEAGSAATSREAARKRRVALLALGVSAAAVDASQPLRGCFLLEILPAKMQASRTSSKRDYWMWSAVSGCTLSRLVQPDAPECKPPKMTFRYCGNVTVDVPQVVARLESLAKAFLL